MAVIIDRLLKNMGMVINTKDLTTFCRFEFIRTNVSVALFLKYESVAKRQRVVSKLSSLDIDSVLDYFGYELKTGKLITRRVGNAFLPTVVRP